MSSSLGLTENELDKLLGFDKKDKVEVTETDSDYAPLHDVLIEALLQASDGKGKERHANGKPFLRQPIMENGRQFGPGGPGMQVAKKCGEAMGMIARGEYAKAKTEVLGAINYAAAMYLLICEIEAQAKGE